MSYYGPEDNEWVQAWIEYAEKLPIPEITEALN